MQADAVDPSNVLARVCAALLRGDRDEACGVARAEYPFIRQTNAGRAYTELQSMRIFLRDRFTDRYSGARLVFPGTLRLLSKVMPEEFPAHPNWKMSESHIAYWELFPSIDHVVPVARGGADDESNWVTTSMLRNSATGWVEAFLDARPEYGADKYIARWRTAARVAREERVR